MVTKSSSVQNAQGEKEHNVDLVTPEEAFLQRLSWDLRNMSINKRTSFSKMYKPRKAVLKCSLIEKTVCERAILDHLEESFMKTSSKVPCNHE